MGSSMRILIVDDNSDDLEFFSSLLDDSDLDYTVYTAPDGDTALDLLSEKPVDCILVDYHMPEVNGVQFLDEMQMAKDVKETPVIILTGDPTQRIQAAAARQGAVDYMVKDLTITSKQLDGVIERATSWPH